MRIRADVVLEFTWKIHTSQALRCWHCHCPSSVEITNTALRYFDRTEPLLGVGGGVVVQGGPVFLDLGYRYKRILARDSLQSVLTAGDVSVSQMRIGVGFRF